MGRISKCCPLCPLRRNAALLGLSFCDAIKRWRGAYSVKLVTCHGERSWLTATRLGPRLQEVSWIPSICSACPSARLSKDIFTPLLQAWANGYEKQTPEIPFDQSSKRLHEIQILMTNVGKSGHTLEQNSTSTQPERLAFF